MQNAECGMQNAECGMRNDVFMASEVILGGKNGQTVQRSNGSTAVAGCGEQLVFAEAGIGGLDVVFVVEEHFARLLIERHLRVGRE